MWKRGDGIGEAHDVGMKGKRGEEVEKKTTKASNETKGVRREQEQEQKNESIRKEAKRECY